MFVQIGNLAINVNHIESVDLDGPILGVYMTTYNEDGTQHYYGLAGDEAEAFRRWWEEKAEVYVAL